MRLLLPPNSLLTLLLPALAPTLTHAQSPPTLTSTTTSTTTVTRTLLVAGTTETHTYTSVIPAASASSSTSSPPSASSSSPSSLLSVSASIASLSSSPYASMSVLESHAASSSLSPTLATVASSTLVQGPSGTSTTGANEATMKPYSYLGAAPGGREVSWWGVVVGAAVAAGMGVGSGGVL